MDKIQIVNLDDTNTKINISNNWTKESLINIEKIEKDILKLQNQIIVFDFTNCTELDFAGATQIIIFQKKLQPSNIEVVFENLLENQKTLLEFYGKHFQILPKLNQKKLFSIHDFGYKNYLFLLGIINFFSFLGEFFVAILKVIFQPNKFRFRAFIKHIQSTSIEALPIIMTLSFLIGLVVAYQSAGYLVKISGDIFVIDLSVMSVFRELAPIIAAILITARSASSFTAEIGVMKITDEIDAMRTMGFDPFIFLVIPRVFALFFMMPFIVFAADMAGVAGILVVTQFHLGIGFYEFIDRIYFEISINELYVGLAKAPLYGVVVAIVGCYQGFMVNKSTESIGTYTTKSVVNALFWVIICDALIAVALTRLGI